MPISCYTNAITLAAALYSNDESVAVNRLLKQTDFCNGYAFTFLMLWMVMG